MRNLRLREIFDEQFICPIHELLKSQCPCAEMKEEPPPQEMAIEAISLMDHIESGKLSINKGFHIHAAGLQRTLTADNQNMPAMSEGLSVQSDGALGGLASAMSGGPSCGATGGMGGGPGGGGGGPA